MLLAPKAISAAPTIPPTRAWEELEGRPKPQVMRFHPMAPRRAAVIKVAEIGRLFESKSAVLMIFLPIILATAEPIKRGAINSQKAAISRAFLGGTARVVIMVTTTLVGSCKPLVKAKRSTSPKIIIRSKGLIEFSFLLF